MSYGKSLYSELEDRYGREVLDVIVPDLDDELRVLRGVSMDVSDLLRVKRLCESGELRVDEVSELVLGLSNRIRVGYDDLWSVSDVVYSVVVSLTRDVGTYLKAVDRFIEYNDVSGDLLECVDEYKEFIREDGLDYPLSDDLLNVTLGGIGGIVGYVDWYSPDADAGDIVSGLFELLNEEELDRFITFADRSVNLVGHLSGLNLKMFYFADLDGFDLRDIL